MDPPSTYVSETNKTPIIQIVTWVLLASAVLCVLLRAYTKWTFIRFFGVDDLLLPASLLFLAGQSAVVTLQTLDGLGKPARDMTPAQLEANYLYQWIATLLYIPSLCFSKLTTLFLLHLISPVRIYQQLFAVTAALIIGWAVSAEFVVAFECGLPSPWRVPGSSCIDRLAFFTYFESMNALTDILMVILPAGIAWGVRSSLKRKLSVLVVFAARGLGVGVMLVKMILYRPAFVDPEPLLTSWPFVICTQLIQFLSLMSACILYLRPFVEALTSGFINGDDLRRRGEITPYVRGTKMPPATAIVGASRPPVLPKPDPNVADWPLPIDPLRADDDDEPGVAREITVPSEEADGAVMDTSTVVIPAPVSSGNATRRFELERTKPGNVYAPSIVSSVGPLRMPRAPVEIPLGENNLPRVSQVYSPLDEENTITSYFPGEGGIPTDRDLEKGHNAADEKPQPAS